MDVLASLKQLESATPQLSSIPLNSSKTFDLKKPVPKKERGPKPPSPVDLLQEDVKEESSESEVDQEVEAEVPSLPRENPRHTA